MTRKWKTIKVFISSTFRDMHAERDHLVRVVFPELKQLCRQKYIQIIDVDLRWGVSEQDAQNGNALDICLNEIDSCRPFFIGLLGHRYGWIPSGQVQSITASEIYHGVLHNDTPEQLIDLRSVIAGKLEGRKLTKEQVNCLVSNYIWDAGRQKYMLNPLASQEDLDCIQSIFSRYASYQKNRSFFFFRTERLSSELAEQDSAAFFEQDPQGQAKLVSLKKEISDQGLWHTEYDRIEPVHDDDLEAFGNKVKEILWNHIQAEAEPVEEQSDWLTEERELHDTFKVERIQWFVGRNEALQKLDSFVGGASHDSLLTVTGPPGSGKSSLLGRFSEEAAKNYPDYLTVSHFVGASSSSASIRQALIRICYEIYESCGFELEKQKLLDQISGQEGGAQDEVKKVEDKFKIPDDFKQIVQTFWSFIRKASETKSVLIIFDAVNQLDPAYDSHEMYWLPFDIPDNVFFVFSTLPGKCLESLEERESLVYRLEGLDTLEVQQVVDQYLAKISKKFPKPSDRKTFLAKLEHGNPLYILVALEELRVFGDFNAVGQRINSLPDTVQELFDQVLDRIENDFERFPGLVMNALCLIACGRQGMTVQELQDLLVDHAPSIPGYQRPTKLPNMYISWLQAAVGNYLFERSGALDFYHKQLEQAVEKRYLDQAKDHEKIHRKIASYFNQKWQEPYVRAIDELPYQLIKSGNIKEVACILSNFDFIYANTAVRLNIFNNNSTSCIY